MSTLLFAKGQTLADPATRAAFGAWSDALVAEGHPAITVVSGDRDSAEQERTFRARFKPLTYGYFKDPFGRFIFDARWWNGVRWARHSTAGTVAVPRTSPHEKKIAADLGYPYNDRDTRAHKRAQQLAPRFGIKWTGINFAEDWHWEIVAMAIAAALVKTTPQAAPAPKPVPFYEKPYGRKKREKTMIAVKIIDGRGLLGKAEAMRTYLVGGGTFIETTDHPTKNQVSVLVNGYTADGKVAEAPNLTYRELYDYAKASRSLTDAELAKYAKAAGVS